MTEKRFTTIYNEKAEMMQYVDNQKEEPNKWAIWNAAETTMKLNSLSEENEQLKVEYKELRYANGVYCESIDALKKENKQLKQQVDSLIEKLNYKTNLELIEDRKHLDER